MAAGTARAEDVPWPRGDESALGLEPGDGPAERRRKLRAALLFWHPDKFPDKFRRVLGRAAAPPGGGGWPELELAAALERAHEVTRRIIAEKAAEGL